MERRSVESLVRALNEAGVRYLIVGGLAVVAHGHAATEVDLFVENPFDFADAHARASRFEVAPGVEAPFVSVPDLIAMKRKAGRPVDLEDIRVLEELQRERGEA